MSTQLKTILIVSLLGLAVALAYWTFSRWRPAKLMTSLALIGVAIGIVAGLAPNATDVKGTTDEIASVVICYLSMVFGMMAEYAYAQAERGEETLKFQPMTFLMPILASPIVFIPLLTITTDVAMGGAFTRAKLMVYLVAFQNGFFWKKLFEQRRRALSEAR